MIVQKCFFPYEPRFVPRDKDLFDLFDTTPDLTGADVDISRFIRDGEESGHPGFLAGYIRAKPGQERPAGSARICPVPFHRFRDSFGVCGGLAVSGGATIAKDGFRLTPGTRPDLSGSGLPFGEILGGYSPDFGWTGEPERHGFRFASSHRAGPGGSAGW